MGPRRSRSPCARRGSHRRHSEESRGARREGVAEPGHISHQGSHEQSDPSYGESVAEYVAPQMLTEAAQAASAFALTRRTTTGKASAPRPMRGSVLADSSNVQLRAPDSFGAVVQPAPINARSAATTSSSSGSTRMVADQPFPGSHVVAVMYAPPAAWTTAFVHVHPNAKWDDVKKHVVVRAQSHPNRDGAPANNFAAYRLLARSSGRALQWNQQASPTMDSMMFFTPPANRQLRPTGVWGLDGAAPLSEAEQVLGVSTLVLAPSHEYRQA